VAVQPRFRPAADGRAGFVTWLPAGQD